MTRSRDILLVSAIGTALGILAQASGHLESGIALVRRIERLDPRLDSLIPPGTAIEAVADGIEWAEGPL